MSPFAEVTIALVNDQWTVKGAEDKKKARPMSDKQELAHRALVSLCAERGEPLPAVFRLPANLRGVKVDAFRVEITSRGIIDNEVSNPHARITELLNSLKRRNVAAERDGWIWPV